MEEMSGGLEQLVTLMVRNCADVLRGLDEGAMFPSVMGSKELPKIAVLEVVEPTMGARLPDCVKKARETARDFRKALQGYVVAWDGYVHIGPERTDAILLEAWETPSAEGHLLAQRYHRKPFELVGSPIRLDGEI